METIQVVSKCALPKCRSGVAKLEIQKMLNLICILKAYIMLNGGRSHGS